MKLNLRDNPNTKNVILTGGKEALLHFAAIQAAPLYGTIEVRNSGAGCRKRRKPC